MVKIIGKNELIRFSTFDNDLDARIDTGAAYSSIGAFDITVLETKIFFSIMDGQKEKRFVSQKLETKSIKSSLGKEERHMVYMLVTIGRREFHSKFSLANRKTMKYPVLIGRSLLSDNFIVDPSAAYLLGAP